MNEDLVSFFSKHPSALPLYEKLEKELRRLVPNLQIRCGATQISFYCPRMFGCVSFLPVRKQRDLPDPYLTVTFGLDQPVSNLRIAAKTEPYPNRWTHHLIICRPEEIDDELLGWMKQAALFAASK